MTAKNISHIHINCSNLERSAAFYELLGFQLERVMGENGDEFEPGYDVSNTPATNQGGNVSRMIGMGLGTDPKTITKLELIESISPVKRKVDIPAEDRLGMVRIAVSVKDMDSCIETIKAAGHTVGETSEFPISKTLSSKYCDIYDPDGTWLSLMEWVKK